MNTQNATVSKLWATFTGAENRADQALANRQTFYADLVKVSDEDFSSFVALINAKLADEKHADRRNRFVKSANQAAKLAAQAASEASYRFVQSRKHSGLSVIHKTIEAGKEPAKRPDYKGMYEALTGALAGLNLPVEPSALIKALAGLSKAKAKPAKAKPAAKPAAAQPAQPAALAA